MRFDIMTLFPELVMSVLGESIIGRAAKAGCISVHAHHIREYSEDKHRRVDDTPYGGGMGMLMAPPPIALLLLKLPPVRLMTVPSFSLSETVR